MQDAAAQQSLEFAYRLLLSIISFPFGADLMLKYSCLAAAPETLEVYCSCVHVWTLTLLTWTQLTDLPFQLGLVLSSSSQPCSAILGSI